MFYHSIIAYLLTRAAPIFSRVTKFNPSTPTLTQIAHITADPILHFVNSLRGTIADKFKMSFTAESQWYNGFAKLGCS